MKKTARVPLKLSKQTLVNLTPAALQDVAGGAINLSNPCRYTVSCKCDSFNCG